VEQARRMRDLLRGHQAALREYAPQPLPVPVHLFPARQSADPELSRGWWATLPATRLRVTPVPGTHLSMMRAPNAATLGEALSRALARALGDNTPRGDHPGAAKRGRPPPSPPDDTTPTGTGARSLRFSFLPHDVDSVG
jgi:hypothetical protein